MTPPLPRILHRLVAVAVALALSLPLALVGPGVRPGAAAPACAELGFTVTYSLDGVSKTIDNHPALLFGVPANTALLFTVTRLNPALAGRMIVFKSPNQYFQLDTAPGSISDGGTVKFNAPQQRPDAHFEITWRTGGDGDLQFTARIHPDNLREPEKQQGALMTLTADVAGGRCRPTIALYGIPTATVVIDPRLQPSRPPLPGLDGGPPRPVGVVVGPDATRDEFVANEVVFRPRTPADLQAFLTQYGGTVLRDGTPFVIPSEGAPPQPAPPFSAAYLIRVDVTRSASDDLAGNMTAAGLSGRITFSSDDATRLAALVARERPRGVSPNFVLEPTACTVCEHPDYGGGKLDAATFPWMTEDDDPAKTGEQGLSIGVIHAWEYLEYMGFPPPPPGGSWFPAVVAIVDVGFDLDETTGVPVNGNIDYRNSFQAPRQMDLVDWDHTAGGPHSDPPKRWHGQMVFGVADAYPGNGFGSAGTGGKVVTPLLVRTDLTTWGAGVAVTSAAASGANVINLSMGNFCHWWCRNLGDGQVWPDFIGYAKRKGAIVVAAIGNDPVAGRNAEHFHPCTIPGVLCVGAIDRGGRAEWYSNYGSKVDIWAPGTVRSTVIRESAAADADNLGIDELPEPSGTSIAAPFVAGIVGLMKALDRSLDYDTVESILRSTANTSTDPKATAGYVDAFRAVAKVKANQPPTVDIIDPTEGVAVSWLFMNLAADVNDPELRGASPQSVAVVFASDRDGQLCTATYSGPVIKHSCHAPPLSLGTHVITATATDRFGATSHDAVTINVINQPPTAHISWPPTGSTYHSNQAINLRGGGIDPDKETIPDAKLTWSSSRDGFLGTGGDIEARLSTGEHVVTLTAEDTFGLSGQASTTVTVIAGDGFPAARILRPGDNTGHAPGTLITFEGLGTDPEDGELIGSRLRWSSDRDGFLGTSNTIAVVLSGPQVPCNPELLDHTVTLEVTDSDGHQATHQIRVHVGVIC